LVTDNGKTDRQDINEGHYNNTGCLQM
jgi:hypothetical protein